jgi:drug/metabolite transporter (DMT)-like permease
MWLELAILSSCIFAVSSIVMKIATLKRCCHHYVLLGMYATATIFFSLNYKPHVINYPISFATGVLLIAIGSFFGNWLVIKALELGSAGITASMLNLNLPLIILISVVFYNEELTLFKIITISLLIIAIVLIKIDPNENIAIKSKSWFYLIIIASIVLSFREGGLKVTQEIKFDNQIILFFSYLLCLLFALVFIITYEIKLTHSNRKLNNRIMSLKYGAISGVGSWLGLHFFSKALLSGPTSLVVLIFSARSIVITIICYLLFKEKLSLFQAIAILLSFIGLIFANFIH